MYFEFTGAVSVLTLCQPASSSSANIMEREVFTPCPISELGIINVVVPSSEIRIQIPRSSAFSTFAAKPVFGSYANPNIKPV
jgi:hypothetical protein